MQASQTIDIPRCLQGHGAFKAKTDTDEMVEEFLACNLRSMDSFRLPFDWIYEVFLRDSQTEKTDLSLKKFNKICKEVCSRRFPKSSSNRCCKVTSGFGIKQQSNLACMVNVFWSRDKMEDLDNALWHITENERHGDDTYKGFVETARKRRAA